MERRTRIVATLGPATDPPGVLEGLIEAGLDVARINFSHGAAEQHLARIARLREASAHATRPIAVLGDLPGPKLRVVIAAALQLEREQEITLATAPGAAADIAVTEPELIRDVQPAQRVLLDDGRLLLRAVRHDGDRLIARVETPGLLQLGKGINLPDTRFHVAALTPRDLTALETAARGGADWLALSFVRGPEAAAEVRAAAQAVGLDVPVLAKIERPEAVQRAGEIIEAFDGIMVARGDLGVEMPLERVPHIQKKLIRQARNAGKPVVTATEMLESMRGNARPTRAEVSDVANAIYDGTDAVMLSGETAVGQFPRDAVQTMAHIICETESHLSYDTWDVLVPRDSVVEQITQGACAVAQAGSVRAIIVPTTSGHTVSLFARHRPRARIIAPAVSEATRRQLALYWGLVPVPMTPAVPGEDRLAAGVQAAFAHGSVQVGDVVVVMAGHPIAGGARVPTIRVVRVGAGGQSGSP